MSFFKKLFGSEKTNTPDIESLLASDDAAAIIETLDDHILKLSDLGARPEKLNNEQRTLLLNREFERELNNGGFSQFFFNSAGNYAKETVVTLQTIGAYKTAELLQKAIDEFPKNFDFSDRTARQDSMEQIEENAEPVWQELDNKFYEYEDSLTDLNIEYIRKNSVQFKFNRNGV